MKIKITRDQAVWERERFDVEVPDDFEDHDEDDQREIIETAIESFDGYCGDGYSKEILDEAVYGINTQTVAELPDGGEMEL